MWKGRILGLVRCLLTAPLNSSVSDRQSGGPVLIPLTGRAFLGWYGEHGRGTNLRVAGLAQASRGGFESADGVLEWHDGPALIFSMAKMKY
jgi:hypothetical protein